MTSTLEAHAPSNLCIFCYKKSDSHKIFSSEHKKISDSVYHPFFTLFLRHIQSDCQDGIQSQIQWKQLGTQFNCDQLGFCQECGIILQRFCDLYHQIKCLELRVNWQVDKLWNAMTYADRVPSRIMELKEAERRGSENTNYVDKLIGFRQKLKRWCKMHENNRLPRVVVLSSSPVNLAQENGVNLAAPTDLEPPLELKSFCFYCYKRKNHHKSFCNNLKKGETFFTLLFRYFISAKKGQRAVKDRQKELLWKGKETMEPCQECKVITAMFCDLYHQMKCLDLRLDWQIEKLWNALEYADIIPSRVNQFMEVIESNENKKLLELRNHLRRSCKIHLIKKNPRVLLSSLSLPLTESVDMESESPGNVAPVHHLLQTAQGTGELSESESKPQVLQQSILPTKGKEGPSESEARNKGDNDVTGTRKSAPCIHCDKRFNSLNARNSHRKKCSKRRMITPRKINPNDISLQFTKITKGICESKPTPIKKPDKQQIERPHSVFDDNMIVLNTNERKCKICSQNLITKHKVHLARLHPEIFFTSSKSSSWSDDQFKKYVKRLLNQQVSGCCPPAVDDDGNRSGKRLFQCSHCSTQFRTKNAVLLHFLRTHVDIFARKLEDLQKTMSPEAAFAALRRPSKCEICAKICRNFAALKQHKVSSHPEIFLLSHKFPTITIDQFKNYVAIVITREVHSFEKVVNKISGDLDLKCSHCQRHLKVKHTAHLHLVVLHCDILGNKLKELQQSTTPEEVANEQRIGRKLTPCTFCGKPFNGRTSYRAHRKVCTKRTRKLPMNPKSKKCWVCSICSNVDVRSKVFNEYGQLKTHNVLKHPETFFLSSKLEHVSSEQFKIHVGHLVDELMMGITKCRDEVTRNEKLKCPHCSKLFSCNVGIKYHMFGNHCEIYAKKLENLQTSPKSYSGKSGDQNGNGCHDDKKIYDESVSTLMTPGVVADGNLFECTEEFLTGGCHGSSKTEQPSINFASEEEDVGLESDQLFYQSYDDLKTQKEQTEFAEEMILPD